jgi:GT2 family glycosyltransferase
MKVSVLIPTYQRKDTALNLGIQCRKFAPECEIIIVDASPNIAPTIIQEAQKNKIKYLVIPEKDTRKAKNIGWQKAIGDIIIFFDDDVEIHTSTITNHVNAYSDSSIISTAGRVINEKDEIPENTDVETGRMNNLGTIFLMNFWSTKKQFVDFPYGCNMSFRRSVLEKIGGFNETYSFEEIDLGLKAKKYGKILFLPEALLTHHQLSIGGTRTNKELYQKEYWKNWGKLIRIHVLFPLRFISLCILTFRSIKLNYQCVQKLYEGFFG